MYSHHKPTAARVAQQSPDPPADLAALLEADTRTLLKRIDQRVDALRRRARRATVARLDVEPLGSERYRVTGGRAAHVVVRIGPAPQCDCADYRFRNRRCKHVVAVERAQREAWPLVDGLSDEQVLELLGPDWSTLSSAERNAHGQPRPTAAAGPSGALAQWRSELAAGTRSPTTFDALWQAACAELAAVEEGRRPTVAPELSADSIGLKYRRALDRIAREKRRAREQGGAA